MFGKINQLISLIFLLLCGSVTVVGARSKILHRQLPANATGVKTITTPNNVTIRYKEPGKQGVCETTPGVNSYTGYVDLASDVHTFFWFFEARNNASTAPITLWLNGGPGSDSLIGLFEELGPCNVTEKLTTQVNPYSWSEASNLLFLSQPLGTGFSYSEEEPGTINNITGDFEPASMAGANGRYPVINSSAVDTTNLAAIAAWEVLQGFYGALPQLDNTVKSKDFNLWTESYGGHYGPAFYNYFYQQNLAIANGSTKGVQLSFNTLGVGITPKSDRIQLTLQIGNGIIDPAIQSPWYPEFAANNTYGVKAVNDTIYNYMKFACYMKNGCLDQISLCRSTNMTSLSEHAICAEAQYMCRDNVEGPYYQYSGRGVYDIRHPSKDPTPPSYYVNYLNQAPVAEAIGVNLNYTTTQNLEIKYAFQLTGDFVYPYFLKDLERILGYGVRVILYYGDADYRYNWFGGQAVSLAVNYTHAKQFRSSGYAPLLVDGKEYGVVREYGNFSFVRVYEAGHEVPYYQPVAALELFRRAIQGLDLATGTTAIIANLSTGGEALATHTEPFVALPTSTSVSAAPSASSSGHYLT